MIGMKKILFKNVVYAFVSLALLGSLSFVYANNFGADPAGPGGGGGTYGNWNTGGAYGYSSGGYNYSECGGCWGGADTGGDGGYGDGYGGYGGYHCISHYAPCESDANICGWKNYGTQDISCGGSCSAQKPQDPSFRINGELKKVGDSCYALDSCGHKITGGVVTCNAECSTKTQNVSCVNPSDNPSTYDNSGGGFDANDTIILRLPQNIISHWPLLANKDNFAEKRYVALYAIPPLVKKDAKSSLVLMLYGLDYCQVEGDNGQVWNYFGLYSKKLKKGSSISDLFKITRSNQKERPECDSETEEENNDKQTNTLSENDSDSSDLKFCKPKDELKAMPDENIFGDVSYYNTKKINTQTVYKVKKCFVVDHNGDIAEYIPNKDNGDKTQAVIKVVPKFIEY